MSEDLDALDRVCAEWMGFHYVKGRPSEGGWHLNANGSLAGMVMSPTPHPTRSWSDFGALLDKCAAEYTVYLQHESDHWSAALTRDLDKFYEGKDPDPRIALCLAVKALSEVSK